MDESSIWFVPFYFLDSRKNDRGLALGVVLITRKKRFKKEINGLVLPTNNSSVKVIYNNIFFFFFVLFIYLNSQEIKIDSPLTSGALRGDIPCTDNDSNQCHILEVGNGCLWMQKMEEKLLATPPFVWKYFSNFKSFIRLPMRKRG